MSSEFNIQCVNYFKVRLVPLFNVFYVMLVVKVSRDRVHPGYLALVIEGHVFIQSALRAQQLIMKKIEVVENPRLSKLV